MKKTPFLALCVLIISGSAWSFQKSEKRSRYTDETYGFSVDAPQFPGVGPKVAYTRVVFVGPPENGFASNVNLRIQPLIKSIEKYREDDRKWLESAGLKVNSARDLTVSGRPATQIDYEGKLGSPKDLRFLNLSVFDKDRVIVITCTSLSDAFEAIAPEFRASLASFRLKDDVRP
jgi:hypothetical protein